MYCLHRHRDAQIFSLYSKISLKAVLALDYIEEIGSPSTNLNKIIITICYEKFFHYHPLKGVQLLLLG